MQRACMSMTRLNIYLVLVVLTACGCAARKPAARSRVASASHYSTASLYESRGEIDKAIREYEADNTGCAANHEPFGTVN